jgi:hypothetical protein
LVSSKLFSTLKQYVQSNLLATTVQKATTLVPVLAFEKNFKDFFSLGLTGSDLTATKSSFTILLTSLGVNTAQVNNYVVALQSYLKIVVASPTEPQKTLMTAQLDAFDVAEKKFVQSFQGLANIEFDIGFGVDPRNADFNSKRTAASAAKTALRLNSAGTYSFFTDPTTATATKFAEYIIAAIAVSDRTKSGA